MINYVPALILSVNIFLYWGNGAAVFAWVCCVAMSILFGFAVSKSHG